MCLGIPGQIISISDPIKKLGMIDVSGVAMSRIDEAEAAKTMEVLLMLGEAQEEIEAMRRSQSALGESA